MQALENSAQKESLAKARAKAKVRTKLGKRFATAGRRGLDLAPDFQQVQGAKEGCVVCISA